jgi:hypothetical protein
MANIIRETKTTHFGKVYYLNNNKIAFYEKVENHFILFDDGSGQLTIKRTKISKKNFEKLSKNA